MFDNKLKLNDAKTEFIILGTKSMLKKVVTTSLQVGDQSVLPTTSVRNIGAFFDSSLHMHDQVKNTCKKAWFHLHSIYKIRHYLNHQQLETVIHAYVISQLDFNNALLVGLPDNLISKLQVIQNAGARLITGTNKRSHITPILYKLHWLPVRQRIIFKILLMAFKAMQKTGPSYLHDLLIQYQPARVLRSSTASLLDVPKTRLKTYGDRSFSSFVPKYWNQLPSQIRDCTSTSSFKSALKTYLFRDYLKDLKL